MQIKNHKQIRPIVEADKIYEKDKDCERILCAAIQIKINKNSKPIIIGGYRHGDCFRAVSKLGYTAYIDQDEQGFITSKGRFVNRKEAKALAKQANQLIRLSDFENLISEDIY